MFCDPGSGERRALTTKAARLRQQGWQHTLVAPGAGGQGQADCGGVAVPGLGGRRMVPNLERAARAMTAQQPDLLATCDAGPLACTLASSDAYVHAGRRDDLDVQALQAMACGTPVVVSTGGNATAGLDDPGRDTCLRVDGTSPHRWAQAISACLLAGPAALGDAGLARART